MAMKVLRLNPRQIAITLDDKEFKARIEKQLSPELMAEGFKVDAIEGPSGGWLIMLRRENVG